MLSCDSCRYSDPTVFDDVDGQGPAAALLCRRYPPIMIFDGDAAGPIWPVVEGTDWCGDHTPRKDHP